MGQVNKRLKNLETDVDGVHAQAEFESSLQSLRGVRYTVQPLRMGTVAKSPTRARIDYELASEQSGPWLVATAPPSQHDLC